MTRRVISTLVAGLAVAVSWTSPVLAAETDPAAPPGSDVEQRSGTLTLSEESRRSLERLELTDLKTGETIRPFESRLDSPCYAPAGGGWFAEYTNGVLTTVAFDYHAWVECPAGLPMGAIVVTAELWKDVGQVDEGPTVNCSNCTVSPASVDYYLCGGVVCAGSYWAANVHSLAAPPGYGWGTAPPGCIPPPSLPPWNWILCANTTESVTIHPTA